MCKFCNSDKKEHDLGTYDNKDSMNISYGQYQGVGVSAYLTMKGNVLFLSGSGSYRSNGDCYYEDEGLDCDNEYSNSSKSVKIKIEYCPFCGKKINSILYERLSLEDTKEKIKDELDEAKKKLSCKQIVCEIEFEYQHRDLSYDKPTPHIEDMSFNELIESPRVINLRADVYYGLEQYYNMTYEYFEPFTFDKKIPIPHCYSQNYKTKIGKYCSQRYSLDEKTYQKLIELGYTKKNYNRFQKTINEKNETMRKIKKYKDSIEEIDKKLKELK